MKIEKEELEKEKTETNEMRKRLEDLQRLEDEQQLKLNMEKQKLLKEEEEAKALIEKN